MSTGSADELRSTLGAMLDHVSDRVRKLAEDWIAEQRDIGELCIVLGVRRDGGGAVFSRARREFAAEIVQDAEDAKSPTISGVANELLTGPVHRIPAVFLIQDPPAMHVMWIEAISAAGLH